MSSDKIRAELFGDPPFLTASDAVDAAVCAEHDRRLVAGRNAVAGSTNLTPRARARLLALAGRFTTPVTMLRFPQEVSDLLRQHAERGRPDVTAADVCAYAAIMRRDAGADQLRSEGAAAVHDVPGRRQGVTPAEAAARFFFG
ncbi:ATP-binding protein [Streptomyces sp. SL13]|uniref:ATP-binding protein n=1 Tax=Streptantibioticus silvisoli TaxID=2705255 RepID=A0AA90H266_9ACTN|nr:AAA family ATPase [Streptantibioticus silvisoli]MDI5969623.1 ATP-binding protein [Streptantibioticus silvisoli]